MNVNHYIGFDVHKKTINYCVRSIKRAAPDRNASRVVAVRLDQSCAWESAPGGSHRPGWLSRFHHDHEQHPAFVPPANPADAPAINAIPNRNFSEEPQELSSQLACRPMHGLHEKAQSSQDAVAAFLFLQQAQFRVLV